MPLFKIEFKAVLFLACGWSGMRQGMPGDDPEDRKKWQRLIPLLSLHCPGHRF